MPQFVDLSLFYFVRGTDGFLLWGEGLVTSGRANGPSVRSDNLADGLRVLRVTNELSAAAAVLESPVFTYRHQGTISLHLGLKRRPPITALPRWRGQMTSSSVILHQFVRAEKALALGGAAGATPAERAELETIMARAHAVLNLDFRGADAASLGDVIFTDNAGQDAPALSVEGVRGSGAYREGLRVTIAPHMRTSELMVNVRVVGTDDAVLDDVLVRWIPGMAPEFVVPTNQRFGSTQLRVWTNGRLVWSDDVIFLLEIALNTQMVSGAVTLNDRLTQQLERAVQAGNAPANAIANTRSVTRVALSSQSVVGQNLREPWRQGFVRGRGEVFGIVPPPPPVEQYFPQGGGGRATAIMAFVRLLQEGPSFLVDPFFDAIGAADLLPRIAGEVDLTIITSLPDDGERLSEGLVAYLNEARGYLQHGIKVRRVTRADSTEQAFHDRYLIVTRGEAAPRGFLLSNSFSGLARKYPLVVAEMSAGTTGAVLRDIEQMLASKTVTALWPPPGPGPLPYDALGHGWRWYLARLVPRAGRQQREWIAAAQAARWLEIENDGNPRWSTERGGDVLDRLLPLRRYGSRALRRKPGRKREARRASLGFCLATIGERIARGLDLPLSDVVARLSRGDAQTLCAWLRTSFRSPSTWERYGHWRIRMGVHQALLDPIATRDRVRLGLALWSDVDGVMDLTAENGRAFVYRVLLVLEPKLAVDVGVALGDPTFIAAALDWWHLEIWHPAVSEAALSASSAMVRALAVQSLAAPETRGNRGPRPEPPSDAAVPELLRKLEAADPTVMVFACLEWAQRVGSDVSRRALLVAAVDRLPRLASGSVREVGGMLLENANLLAAAVDAFPDTPLGRGTAIHAVKTALADAVSAPPGHREWGELAACAPGLAAVFLATDNANYARAQMDVDNVLDLVTMRRRIDMISPFRHHPDSTQAAARLGFAQLLMLHMRRLTGEDVAIDAGPPWSLVAQSSSSLHAVLMKAVQES